GPSSSPAQGPGPITTGPTDACVDDTFNESRAMSGDCQAACEIFFCCAERECDGLDRADRAEFIAECLDGCSQQTANIAVVNGEDCATTVSTVRGASPDFAETCDDGI